MNLSCAIFRVFEKGEETLVFATEILTISIASSTTFSAQGQKVLEEKPQSQQRVFKMLYLYLYIKSCLVSKF
jgi:hypothetical protein